MMKILIAAPLRQEPHIFREYQKSLDNLVIPDGVTVERFFVVNDCPEVIPEIRGDYIVANTGDEYRKTDNDHLWTQQNLWKMHALRNVTIRETLRRNCDYLFSIDTDLVLHPDTLIRLLEADKDIVSELFHTNNWCNAWMAGQYMQEPEEWKAPGLYQVGMTGACMLVKRKVLLAGVDYSPIPNLGMWGEDRHFCVRAAVAGFELWTDTHCEPAHLYTEAAYQAWKEEQK